VIKKIIVGISCLGLIHAAAIAGPDSAKAGSRRQEVAGLGLGAVIGGLIAGPPGAIIGAAGGAWYGDRQTRKAMHTAALETRLIEKQAELAQLQAEFAELESSHGRELQRVKLDQRASALEQLSNGVSFTVLFRTNSAALNPEFTQRVERLAQYLRAFPEIQLHLEAHADPRGATGYNLRLSEQRAEAVMQALVQAGLAAERVHMHAYGETMARSAAGDAEGQAFDRRVTLQLSLDTESYALQ
jgi:outer membrane protein OmpA-like peptidoglycan-associated protein